MSDIYVTRPSIPDFDEYCNEIRPLWDSLWLTNMGEKHEEFQKSLETYLGVPYIELLTNGHMALELTLQAMNLKGEVITTPFTFVSTTHAIVRNGLTPVFCDIDPDTYTIDPAKIEGLITENTCAILPVHVYGSICDVEAIQKIADQYHLKVIYDAAHAFGESFQQTPVGNFGDASIFSFHATKVFHSIEGGCVAFQDPALGKRLYELKNFGIQDTETVSAVGANAKMNEFCAAMGICNLRHIDREIARRKLIFEHYHHRLANIKGIQILKIDPTLTCNYSYYPVQFDPSEFGASRDDIHSRLAEHGIYTRKYFYPLTSSFDAFHGQFDVTQTPIALKVSHQILTLPLYASLTLEDVDRICDLILSR